MLEFIDAKIHRFSTPKIVVLDNISFHKSSIYKGQIFRKYFDYKNVALLLPQLNLI